MPFRFTCETCGKVFTRPGRKARGAHVYCSLTCRSTPTRNSLPVPCPKCGKVILRRKSAIAQNRQYCSRECWLTHSKIEKVCPVCGKTFSVNRSNADRYTVCSMECRLASTKYVICERCGKTFRAETHLNRHYCSEECRRPPVNVVCKTCGKQFRVVPSSIDRQFCSLSCYRKSTGETLPEKSIRLALADMGIAFIQEGRVGRYSVDFLLPSVRIALEIDGVYWHQDEKRDARKTAFLRSYDWDVCRITDIEISECANLDRLIADKLAPYVTDPIQPSQLTLL